ncbi:mediator complex subunit Med14 [Rhizoctonia solani]|uniref:Mediator of RNA polymerase II transcription subunit 14 n=1 Tax=Rhizoctonia solani TaxID=456999 RepID=A0A8H8NZH6_9AGAM|nr:mediator complex subunit Med14 [Rhizoctonia solani]QRW21525.1 mediator complex subunit Med14 [Rhizoctonia solani]
MHDPEVRSAPSHPLKIRIHRDSISKGAPSPTTLVNGHATANGKPEPREEDEALPRTLMGQVPLSVAVSRIVQNAYAELGNMAETLPSQSDHDRKRHIFQYVLTTRKGFVKMYVATKWAENARAVQTCLDIMQYCNRAGEQLQLSSAHLSTIANALGSLRIRNADLLTALDVLTTGTYRRLPSITKELYTPQKPMSKEDIVKVMRDTDAAIRLRLRSTELLPTEMNSYRVADGRVYFTVPNRFMASFTVLGGTNDDPWWCADVEFLFELKGERSTAVQYPRIPPKQMRSIIQQETNALLAHIHNQRATQINETNDLASINRNSDVVDAPLIRAFNFLQLLSLTYQLEILHYQANLMRTMGLADVLTIELAPDRKSMKIWYWVTKNRRAGQPPGKPDLPLPPHGGLITVSIQMTSEAQLRELAKEREQQRKSRGGKARPGLTSQAALLPSFPSVSLPQSDSRRPRGGQSWAVRVREDLERRSKLAAHATARAGADVNPRPTSVSGAASGSGLGGDVGGVRPSDEVEHARFLVKWEPVADWLGISVPREVGDEDDLQVDASALSFATIYHNAIRKHSDAITRALHTQVPDAELKPFGPAGNLAMVQSRILVSISPRNGFVLVQDTADMASPGRVSRFTQAGEAVSRQPQALAEQVALLKFAIIADSVEQQVRFLGYPCTRNRGFPPRYQVLIQKFGHGARHFLFTPLAGFPSYDVVIIVADEGFRYGLIETEVAGGYVSWKDGTLLDVESIRRHKAGVGAEALQEQPRPDFEIDGQTLRDVHAYCRARVSYALVEAQLRYLTLPYTIAYNTKPGSTVVAPPARGYPLSQSIPALAVSATDLFRKGNTTGDKDKDVEDQVAIEVIGWWNPTASCQVATSVRLKHAPPVSSAKSKSRSGVLRITPRLYYNTLTHVVTFVSESVEGCVGSFLAGWTSVRRLIVIAREIVKMHKTRHWKDVKLLSSDLQQVVFQYFQDYTLSIRWRPAPAQNELSANVQTDSGSYELSFSCLNQATPWNPHSDLESHFTRRLQDDLAAGDITSFAVLLRDSLPVLLEINRIAIHTSINARLDVFYKAVGWYRVLIDSRYGLDFRLLSRRRLAILDATQSLDRPVLAPIPLIEGIVKRLVPECQLISLSRGALVSFDEDGAKLQGVGVKFVERVIRVLSMGEAGLS